MRHSACIRSCTPMERWLEKEEKEEKEEKKLELEEQVHA